VSEMTKRGLELSITAVFVLALLLVGAVLVFSGGTATAKQIASLRLFGGQVLVQHGSGAFSAGTEGASLREGDTVRTGSDGRASIEYFDGSLTRLDYDTSFTLVTLESLEDSAGSKVIEGEQSDGNSFNLVTELVDAESRFDVRTPTATASVRGTVYALIVDEGTTTVAVLEGAVSTIGDSTTVDVPAGKMVVVGWDGSIGRIRDISQEILESDWIMFNRCELDDLAGCEGSHDEQPEDRATGSTSSGGEPAPSPPAPTGGVSGGQGPPPPAPDQPPVAGFTASPRVGQAPLHVRFADASSDPDGDPISRHWIFGDGSARSGGQVLSHTYTQPGRYVATLTVTDTDGDRDAMSRVIDVVPAVTVRFDHIVISPANATIQAGGSRAFTSEAFDTAGNPMGDVTASTVFSITPDGSCNGNTCTATQPGSHTVTGTYSGSSDDAELTVEAPPPPACPHYGLAFHTRPPASQDAGHQFNVQVRVDVLDGGSDDGPLGISLQLEGGSFSGGDTFATWTGQGTVTFNHLKIDAAGTYGLIAVAECATPTETASITITDASGSSRHETGLAAGSVPHPSGLIRRR
jgi:PKD repeat protein